jgi:hypothetical protein
VVVKVGACFCISISFSRLPPEFGGTRTLKRRKLARRHPDAGKVAINCGENMASARRRLRGLFHPV